MKTTTKKPIKKTAPKKGVAKKSISKSVVKTEVKETGGGAVKSLKGVKRGTWFNAILNGTKLTGIIQFENGKYYLCQQFSDGSSCSDRLGFDYSWSVGIGSEAKLKENGVRNMVLLSGKPRGFHLPQNTDIIIHGYNVVLNSKNTIKIGCHIVKHKDVIAVYNLITKKKVTKKSVKK